MDVVRRYIQNGAVPPIINPNVLQGESPDPNIETNANKSKPASKSKKYAPFSVTFQQ